MNYHYDATMWKPLSEAISFSLDHHAKQTRKGTLIPYPSHTIGVAALVLEYGGDSEQAQGGALHDTIEDCDVTYETLEQKFGRRVADMVQGCSDTDGGHPKPPWRERKEKYIAHLDDAGPDVLIVSACDKLHNVRCIVSDLMNSGDDVFARFKGGKEGTLWYYRALADKLSARLPGTLTNDLDTEVKRMEQLALA